MNRKLINQSDLADILFPQDVEDFSDSIMDLPPEKRRLNTESVDSTVHSLIERFRANDIYIPNFQRTYIWTKTQASRLIESLIIQCPIPVIYLSQDSDGRLAIVDGNQRINAINKYLKDEYGLIGLTAYPELTGKKYSELDPRFQRHINSRVIRTLTILKETHPQVKFDVFERLNTGSMKLSPQELRHGIYYGDLIKLCNDISKDFTKEETEILGTSSRLKVEELVLRYFAFSDRLEKYAKPLSNFLNEFAEQNKKLSETKAKAMKVKFSKVLARAIELFGENAFRITKASGRNPFNSALFDIQMHVAKNAPEELSSKRYVSGRSETS